MNSGGRNIICNGRDGRYGALMAVMAMLTACQCVRVDYAANSTTTTTTTTRQRYEFDENEILKDVYATISKNLAENSRKLNLQDFSWGIFGGSEGRLQGFDNFQLVNNKTVPKTQNRTLNVSFEFTVPKLAAVWQKSLCLGYSCVMTMELDDAEFVLRTLFDERDCVFEHLAYLKSYRSARCLVSYLKTSSIPTSFVQTTVALLSRVMNTQPFRNIIKNNVDYALLQLPLFQAADIQRICDATAAYKRISSSATASFSTQL